MPQLFVDKLPVIADLSVETVNIGEVQIADVTTGETVKVADGSTIITTDKALAVHDANSKAPAVSAGLRVKPYHDSNDVGTAGVHEELVGTATPAIMFLVQAKSDNDGNIFLGDSSASASVPEITLTPGKSFGVDVPVGYRVDLHDWWIDAAESGDGVWIFYVA